MEGSLMDTNIVHDDCPADSEEGTATNEERIDCENAQCENAQHHQLMSIQDAEERLIKNSSDNHIQIMCVQEKMLAEITEVKDILRCTVSELRKHNTHMEAIITCLMKHNELQRSNVIPTFLPSTYVATLEAAEFLPNSSDQLFDTIPTIVTQLPGSCEAHENNVTENDMQSIPLQNQSSDDKIATEQQIYAYAEDQYDYYKLHHNSHTYFIRTSSQEGQKNTAWKLNSCSHVEPEAAISGMWKVISYTDI
ncbi:hypothetical protein FKM82_001921 [Ascaphus truei]